jgi:hypothetical protein
VALVTRWRDLGGSHSRRRPWCITIIGNESGAETSLPFLCYRTRELAEASAAERNLHTRAGLTRYGVCYVASASWWQRLARAHRSHL